jgi:lipopolysaccharide assembly protein B
LNEQPDKALEVFIRMVDMDADTVDTHFALGTLFRRRGETERAIKVHQNLVARPDLPREARARALNELAEDYFKAGLFDRAEQVYSQVARVPRSAKPGLAGWCASTSCSATGRRPSGDGPAGVALSREAGGSVVAHYCCELAQDALARGDLAGGQALAQAGAQGADREGVRGAMMRAAVAQREGDHKLAVRLYEQALERDGGFLVDVLPELRLSHASWASRRPSSAGSARRSAASGVAPGWHLPRSPTASSTMPSRASACAISSQQPDPHGDSRDPAPDAGDDGREDAAVRRISGPCSASPGRARAIAAVVCGFSGNAAVLAVPELPFLGHDPPGDPVPLRGDARSAQPSRANPRASAEFSLSRRGASPGDDASRPIRPIRKIREFDMIRIANNSGRAGAAAGARLGRPGGHQHRGCGDACRALKGVGPARAEAIVAWREANGPFKSPEDLVLVQGIGERVLEDNRGCLIKVSRRRKRIGADG